MTDQFETKQSGDKAQFDSGMQRDTQAGKPRFDLIIPKKVPFRAQMLTRFALLMARGAAYYGDRNWELASGQEELDRFKSSGLRHMLQWYCGETDEDHAAAVLFNVTAHETTLYKMQNDEELEAGYAALAASEREETAA